MFNWKVLWGIIGTAVSGFCMLTAIDMLRSGLLTGEETFSITVGFILFALVFIASIAAIFIDE
jgi:hypothetical protein